MQHLVYEDTGQLARAAEQGRVKHHLAPWNVRPRVDRLAAAGKWITCEAHAQRAAVQFGQAAERGLERAKIYFAAGGCGG
jgi:hypothetical protein